MNITHHFDDILCRAGHRSWRVLVRCTNSLQLITSQPHSDSAASWVVFSTVCYVCVCLFVCLFVCMCLFVNAITLEPFEISSWNFTAARLGQKLGRVQKCFHSDMLRHVGMEAFLNSFELLTKSRCRKISRWYLKRFKSYCVDKQTDTKRQTQVVTDVFLTFQLHANFNQRHKLNVNGGQH